MSHDDLCELWYEIETNRSNLIDAMLAHYQGIPEIDSAYFFNFMSECYWNWFYEMCDEYGWEYWFKDWEGYHVW